MGHNITEYNLTGYNLTGYNRPLRGIDVLSYRYHVLYVDPPWWYSRTFNGDPKYGGIRYPMLTDTELAALPIHKVAEQDCFLFLWTTAPKLAYATDLLSHWGFTYVTVAFVWVKTPRSSLPYRTDEGLVLPRGVYSGLGSWTNSNAEFVLLGKRGRPRRNAKDVKQICLYPVGTHSEKPIEIHHRIDRLVLPTYTKLELFARRDPPPPICGLPWAATGLDYDGVDIRCLHEI